MEVHVLVLFINIAIFIAGIVYLAKSGYHQTTIDTMLAGMSGANLVSNVSNIIVGIIGVSSSLIIISLVLALMNLFFFNLFIKRAGV